MAEVNELKVTLPALEEEQKTLGAELDKELAQIPNMPLDEVPDGADASGNVEHHVVGKKRDYAFKPKQHFELGEALGMMDFELAAKLSGARFVVLQKSLAGSSARSGSSCSMCIRARSTDTRKSIRQFLCATM